MDPVPPLTDDVSPLPPAHPEPTFEAIYGVGGELLSILDLLQRFQVAEFEQDGMSRLADLHLKVGEPARYRLDGELIRLKDAQVLTPDLVRGLVHPLLRRNQVEALQSERPTDVDAAFHLEGEAGMNFRINAFHDREGLAAVIRALPQVAPEVEALGFPDPDVLQDILNLRAGLVIVSGITGSGKSTTIASMLARLNRVESLRVITLEDPIEYLMTSDRCLISQREIGVHVPSFHVGLRSALREDPDVILVGEIRDTETAGLALTAAETGHLVFSTLHTRDARGAISRLVDLFPAERNREVMTQLSFSLSYVVAQKLMPHRDGKGRVAAFEILRNVPAVSNLIRTGNWHQIYATMQLSRRDHMITMERHLEELATAGRISPEVARQHANDRSQQVSGTTPVSAAG